MPDIIIPYRPRAQFRAYHNRPHRWALMLAHRRAGKTVATVNELIKDAIQVPGRYAYIAPYYVQAKDIAWNYLKHYSAPLIKVGGKVNEADLSVTLPNTSTIRLYGAENAERLRGIGLHGVVCDEYADFPPYVWAEILLPTLSDARGWATFIGTPKGRNNGLYRTAMVAKDSPEWFYAELRASETGIIEAQELAHQRGQMTPSQYAQEYECSFEAAIKGAIYSEQLEALRADRRIGRVPYDPALPVDTYWDIGVGDSTSIGFVQTLGSEVRGIDYHEANGEGIPYYAQVLTAKGYSYGKHVGPHDLAVREFGSGRSRLEVAQSLGLKFELAPNTKLEDGIHATRMLLPRMWFDETKCAGWLDALANYRWGENKALGEFKTTPVHDWASHGADMTRYLAVSLKERRKPKEIIDRFSLTIGEGGDHNASASWMGS